MKVIGILLIFSIISYVTSSETENNDHNVDGHIDEVDYEIGNDEIDELRFCYKYFIDSLKIENFPPDVHDFTFNVDYHSVVASTLEDLCKYQSTFYECIGSSDSLMTYTNLERVFKSDRDTAAIYLSKFHELQFICTVKKGKI